MPPVHEIGSERSGCRPITLMRRPFLSLDKLGGKHRIALVSNIDLLQVTPVPGGIDLVCTAERARGYKPDGTFFRYLIANAGVAIPEILHSGQSQHTDMVDGKPFGLTITWINRRNLELYPSVPKPDYVFPDIYFHDPNGILLQIELKAKQDANSLEGDPDLSRTCAHCCSGLGAAHRSDIRRRCPTRTERMGILD